MIEDALREPDPTDRKALLDVLARAFRDNPMNIEIHGPRPTRRVRANRAGLRAIVLDSSDPVEMRVIAHGDCVVGGYLVAPPELRVLPGPTLGRQIGCFLQQGARAMDRWGRVSHELFSLRPLAPHWYLAVLGVDPEVQGQGMGGLLLEALFARIRGAEAPIYLECDRKSSVGFYLDRGFEILRETEVHGVPCWCLGHGFADEIPDLCDPVRQA